MGIFLVHVNVAIAAMHGSRHRQAERSLIAFSPAVVRGNFGGACSGIHTLQKGLDPSVRELVKPEVLTLVGGHA